MTTLNYTIPYQNWFYNGTNEYVIYGTEDGSFLAFLGVEIEVSVSPDMILYILPTSDNKPLTVNKNTVYSINGVIGLTNSNGVNLIDPIQFTLSCIYSPSQGYTLSTVQSTSTDSKLYETYVTSSDLSFTNIPFPISIYTTSTKVSSTSTEAIFDGSA